MKTKRLSKATAIVIFFMAVAGLFLGCKLLAPVFKPTPSNTSTPSNCPSTALAAEVRTSSTNIKVGETFTVTGVSNRPIGRPFYYLGIEEVGIDLNTVDKNAITDYFLPEGLHIMIATPIISKDIEVKDLDMLNAVKGINFVLRAEQAGSFTVTFGANGETGNDCAGFPIWNNVSVYSDPLTITVTEP
jgi:hypothetical protein